MLLCLFLMPFCAHFAPFLTQVPSCSVLFFRHCLCHCEFRLPPRSSWLCVLSLMVCQRCYHFAWTFSHTLLCLSLFDAGSVMLGYNLQMLPLSLWVQITSWIFLTLCFVFESMPEVLPLCLNFFSHIFVPIWPPFFMQARLRRPPCHELPLLLYLWVLDISWPILALFVPFGGMLEVLPLCLIASTSVYGNKLLVMWAFNGYSWVLQGV